MTHKKLSTAAASAAVGALAWLGAVSIAQQQKYDNPSPADMTSGVVVSSAPDALVVETSDGRKTYVIGEAVSMPEGIEPGDLVLVDVSRPGSFDAERVVLVDEEIVVLADREAERALVGVVTAVSPQQLLVRTMTGEQAFVIDPAKLFPPLPEADQNVAVTYRTVEVHPPQLLATGLILLPSDLEALESSARMPSTTGSAAAITPLAESEHQDHVAAAEPSPALPEPANSEIASSEPALESTRVATEELSEEDLPETATTTAEAESNEEQVTESTPAQAISSTRDEAEFDETTELPQTGSTLPIALGLGSLAFGLAIALRFVR